MSKVNQAPTREPPVGNVLDKGIALFKAALGPVVVLAFASALVRSLPYLFPTWSEAILAGGLLTSGVVDTEKALRALADSLLGVLVTWPIGLFLALGVVAQMQARSRGGVLAWPAALAVAWRRLPATVACCVVYVVVFGLIFGTSLVLGVAAIRAFVVDLPADAIGVTAGLVGMAVALLAAVPLTMLFVYWCLALPLIVTEKLGAVAALGRSWRLVRGNWWRTLVIVSVVGLLVFVVASLAGIAGMALVAVTDGGIGVRTVVVLLNTLGGTLTTPLLVAVLLATLDDLATRHDRESVLPNPG